MLTYELNEAEQAGEIREKINTKEKYREQYANDNK